MKKLLCFAAFIVLIPIVAACASTVGNGETPPSSSEAVSTMVALTLQSLATHAPAATPTPESPTSLLPHSLYFLGNDNQGISQVYRIERDGQTRTQLTSEPVNVDDYDVSPVDGSVVYLTNNQLLLMNPDGSNRRLLLDGGPRETNPWVSRPVFSPDGKTLAYGRQGLNLLDLSTGASNLVIPNQYGEPLPSGAPFPIESYEPVSYSPDGTKLLLALGHWEVLPSHAVYYPDRNELIRYAEVKEYLYCCSFHGGPVWSPDSASFYGVASAHDYTFLQGALWRVDAANGAVTTVLPATNGTGIRNLPKEPYLAPDGQLYFFFGTYNDTSGYFDAPVLNMARAMSGGSADLTVLRNENFRLMSEALWAPDASFVIVATLPERRWDRGGGVLELYSTDGQKDAVWLAPYGEQMKWRP